MTRLSEWLKKRRLAHLQKYMAKIRNSPEDKKKEFLALCLTKAYIPLYMAFTTLEAPNFVEGTIQEQTTGEFFHIELRKIKREGVVPTAPTSQPFEKDGKYFQEIQIPWADATAEERARWACYQQTHVKRFIEVKKEDIKP